MHFETFWQNYPRHVAKAAALKAWVKITEKVEPSVILAKLEQAKKDWRTRDLEYIPHAATWLRRESFESEVPPPLLKMPADKAWENDCRARAEVLHQKWSEERMRWEGRFALHTHGIGCDFGNFCIYVESKRPIVPTVEELMERMK